MKTIRLFYCVLLLFVMANSAWSQNCSTSPTQPHTTGVCAYVAPHLNPNLHSMVRDRFNDLIVIGAALDPTINSNRIVQLSKTNTSCGIVWWIYYDGPANKGAIANDLTTDDDGNIYVTGYAINSSGIQDIFVAKFDLNGHLLWESSWENTSSGLDDRGNAICVDRERVFVTGITVTSLNTSMGITLAFEVGNGNLIWESYDGVCDKNENYALCTDFNHGLWVVGGEYSGNCSMYTLHLDPASGIGTTLYKNLAPNANIYDMYNMPNAIVAGLRGVYIGATAYNDVNGTNDYYLFSYDYSDNLMWETTFDLGTNWENLEDITIDRSLGIIYATGGSQEGTMKNTRDVVTIALNANTGAFIWQSQIDGSGHSIDYGLEVELDCLSQPFVGAYSTQISGGLTEFLVIQYNSSNGSVTWSDINNNSNATHSSTLHDIAITEHDVFASGSFAHSGSSSTPIILIAGFDSPKKDCSAARLAGNSSESKSEMNLFPNPSNGKCTFYGEAEGQVIIHDIQNRLVMKVAVNSGNNDLDLQNLKNGIYFLQFNSIDGSIIKSEKIAINK